ncbi:hypothetical protein CYY_005362 [Polysphondylium violaceum]|uniref:Uncharacterized protein n=1 Tax=Polysphondylium violaceum TaxID=133409 RepID=A0A8J4PV56_9MYCE|nr:hypothetical protein CYY_005362 [Polysphondylium violaceum]
MSSLNNTINIINKSSKLLINQLTTPTQQISRPLILNGNNNQEIKNSFINSNSNDMKLRSSLKKSIVIPELSMNQF